MWNEKELPLQKAKVINLTIFPLLHKQNSQVYAEQKTNEAHEVRVRKKEL